MESQVAPVDVELTVVGEVVVDHKGDLLHVNATRPHICSDEHPATLQGEETAKIRKVQVSLSPALTTPELFHDGVSLLLWHVAVHGAHGEVRLPHLLCQPVHLPLGVAEDNCLNNADLVSSQ